MSEVNTHVSARSTVKYVFHYIYILTVLSSCNVIYRKPKATCKVVVKCNIIEEAPICLCRSWSKFVISIRQQPRQPPIKLRPAETSPQMAQQQSTGDET